jgi:hypothetical protein
MRRLTLAGRPSPLLRSTWTYLVAPWHFLGGRCDSTAAWRIRESAFTAHARGEAPCCRTLQHNISCARPRRPPRHGMPLAAGSTRSNHSRAAVRERIDSKEQPCANASTREQSMRERIDSAQRLRNFVRVALAGIEPVGFRVKSDLRNHQAIVQPRLYDSLMVTQITLNSKGIPKLADTRPRNLKPRWQAQQWHSARTTEGN